MIIKWKNRELVFLWGIVGGGYIRLLNNILWGFAGLCDSLWDDRVLAKIKNILQKIGSRIRENKVRLNWGENGNNSHEFGYQLEKVKASKYFKLLKFYRIIKIYLVHTLL